MREEQPFGQTFEVRCAIHGTMSHAEMEGDDQYGGILYWCTQCSNRIIIYFGEETKRDRPAVQTKGLGRK